MPPCEVPTRAVRELARLTLAVGAPDNLTAIVVRIGMTLRICVPGKVG